MTDAVFCLMDLSWQSWFWDFQFCPLPLSLSLPLCLCSPSFSVLLTFSLSSTVTSQSLPFCFSMNFRHNYCVIAGDRESVVVDVLLSFLTDTQPSALVSVGVYPSHPRSLLHNMISCVYWRERSVSIDTSNNMPELELLAFLMWRAYKDGGRRRGCCRDILDERWPFCLHLDHLGLPLSPKRNKAFWELWHTTWAAVYAQCGRSTTPAPTARGDYCPSVQVDGWLWLVKSVAPVAGLTCDWQ